MALKDADDPYLVTAAMSSVNKDNIESLLESLLTIAREDNVSHSIEKRWIPTLTGLAVAMNNAGALEQFSRLLAKSSQDRYAPWKLESLAEFLDAMDRQNLNLSDIKKKFKREYKSFIATARPIFDFARQTVSNSEMSPMERAVAVRLLGRQKALLSADMRLLVNQVDPTNTSDLISAVLESVIRINDKHVPQMLLSPWPRYSPELRMRVTDVLLSRSQWTIELMQTLEKGRIPIGQIDLAQRQRLLIHPKEKIRLPARKLLAKSMSTDRQTIIEKYRPAFSLAGNVDLGKNLFQLRCAMCHQLGGIGNNLGPNLDSLADRSFESLLAAILDPNRSVESKYLMYLITTKNDRVLFGHLVNETNNTVTSVGVTGEETTIFRREIKSLNLLSPARSPMPDGMETLLSLQEMADLISYIVNAGHPSN